MSDIKVVTTQPKKNLDLETEPINPKEEDGDIKMKISSTQNSLQDPDQTDSKQKELEEELLNPVKKNAEQNDCPCFLCCNSLVPMPHETCCWWCYGCRCGEGCLNDCGAGPSTVDSNCCECCSAGLPCFECCSAGLACCQCCSETLACNDLSGCVECCSILGSCLGGQ